jgi:hypothetical protein
VRGDGRSRRIAIVPDRVLNPGPGEPDMLAQLAADGWGVVALPPGELRGEAWLAWAGPIVDQVVTFLADGYEVAICGPAGDDETDRFRAAVDAAGWSIDRDLRLP